jgi:hypothetical protein
VPNVACLLARPLTDEHPETIPRGVVLVWPLIERRGMTDEKPKDVEIASRSFYKQMPTEG